MEVRKCVKCGASSAKDAVDAVRSYHRFPSPNLNNFERLQKWAQFMYPDQTFQTLESLVVLHKQHKVLCSAHFPKKMMYRSGYLSKFAVPSVEATEANRLEATSTKETQTQVAQVAAQDPRPSASTSTQETQISTTTSVHIETETTSIEEGSKSLLMCEQGPNLKAVSPSTTTVEAGTSSVAQDITETPKKQTKSKVRRTILKDLGVSRINQLTPRKLKLYHGNKIHVKDILRLKRTCRKLKKADMLEKIYNSEHVDELAKKLTGPVAVLIQSQLRNVRKKPKSRRWTLSEKAMAVAIYKKSPACYRLLRRLFCLPSHSLIKRLLSNITLEAGINKDWFTSLEKFLKKLPENDKYCTLMFDEMAIRKNFMYNPKKDKIEGFEDHGPQGRTKKVATTALVFMISSIRSNWHQPVGFYFSGSGGTSAERMHVFIKEIIDNCVEAGVVILSTVCDMGTANRKALKMLGASTEVPYFVHKGKEVTTIYDPPHLIKCFRNLLMKYDLECTPTTKFRDQQCKGVAKWKYIKDLYVLEEKQKEQGNYVFCQKLTKPHINPNGKEKMRVKLATQVMSHSVSGALLAKVSSGELPLQAVTTANLVEDVDQLFDSLNANSSDRKNGKKYSTNLTQRSGHLELWAQQKQAIRHWKWLGARATPPSQNGWIATIEAVERLFKTLQRLGFYSVSTNRLNQDNLENMFGGVRSSCGNNSNPTVQQFIAGLKTVTISGIVAHSRSSNCILQGQSHLLNNLENFICKAPKPKTDKDELFYEMFEEIVPCNTSTQIDVLDPGTQAAAYVSGFILKKIQTGCEVCKGALYSKPDLVHTFVQFKEYSESGGSLVYASERLTSSVKQCTQIINSFLETEGHTGALKERTLYVCKSTVDFSYCDVCIEHKEFNVERIITSTFYISVKRYCILKNQLFAAEASAQKLKRKLDILKHK